MLHTDTSKDIVNIRLEHGKANAFDLELCEAFIETFDSLSRSDTRGVTITGTGNIFSAGVDLFRLLKEAESYGLAFLDALKRCFEAVFEFPRPVVAAINGHAIAGGCILACACDYRVIAESGGRIGVPELKVGVPFPGIALAILRNCVPADQFNRLVLTGATLQPAEAMAAGLVDELVDADDLGDRANAVARQMAGIPAETFSLTKHQLRQASRSFARTLDHGTDGRVLELWTSKDIRSVIRAYLDATVGKKGNR